MSAVKTLESVDELEKTISHSTKAAILFTKSWCPWCAKIKPIFEEAAKSDEFSTITFCLIVLDNHAEPEELWHKPRTGVPQIHVYEGSAWISEELGYMERDAFYRWLRSVAYGNSDSTHGAAGQVDGTGSSNELCALGSDLGNHARPMCEGKFEERRKRTILFSKNKKTFSDLEPNCVFRPTDEDHGILIGRANDDASYFDIILWNAPHQDPGRVYFSLDFMPDPVKNARFESVMFSVTFGKDSEDDERIPLAIKDLFPVDSDDVVSRPLLPSETHVLDDDASYVSSLDDERSSDVSGTSTVIRGQGVHSPTAVWNISEAKATSSRAGLDAHYSMYITLPASSRVWMKFWAKAVLVSGEQVGLGLRHRATLRIGTAEKPYERVLDLSEVLK